MRASRSKLLVTLWIALLSVAAARAVEIAPTSCTLCHGSSEYFDEEAIARSPDTPTTCTPRRGSPATIVMAATPTLRWRRIWTPP